MQSCDSLGEQIQATGSVEQALGVLARSAGEIGIERFIAGFVRGSARKVEGGWRQYRYRTFNFPSGWDEDWSDFNADCPYYHACFGGRIAFDWQSVRTQEGLTPAEVRAWQYLADQGLAQGYTVPVHAPNHFGFITVIGEPDDRGWIGKIERRSEKLLYLTHAFHQAVRERFPAFVDSPNAVVLSGREQQCLRWAAAGKTTEEVALILDLSHETVRVYFKRALRKVGASTRAQAIANAYELGLLY